MSSNKISSVQVNEL